MEVIRKGKTIAGEDIQVEDWSGDYPEVYSYGSAIGAYPRDVRRKEDTVRVSLQFETAEEANKAFEDLEAGRKIVRDFKENFSNQYHGAAADYMNY